VVDNVTAAQDLSQELRGLGLQVEISLAYLGAQDVPSKSLARIEGYESPPKKLTTTGHFNSALQVSERPLAAVLAGMGMPKHEARRYEGLVRSGSVLVSVFCSDMLLAKQAKTVLQKRGAREIASTGDAPAEVELNLSTK
jgi:hypothetical protein